MHRLRKDVQQEKNGWLSQSSQESSGLFMLRTIWRVRTHEVLEPEGSEIQGSESRLQEFNLVDRSCIDRRSQLSGRQRVVFHIKQETLSTYKPIGNDVSA